MRIVLSCEAELLLVKNGKVATEMYAKCSGLGRLREGMSNFEAKAARSLDHEMLCSVCVVDVRGSAKLGMETVRVLKWLIPGRLNHDIRVRRIRV